MTPSSPASLSASDAAPNTTLRRSRLTLMLQGFTTYAVSKIASLKDASIEETEPDVNTRFWLVVKRGALDPGKGKAKSLLSSSYGVHARPEEALAEAGMQAQTFAGTTFDVYEIRMVASCHTPSGVSVAFAPDFAEQLEASRNVARPVRVKTKYVSSDDEDDDEE